jgi:hypothetical protein
LEDSLFETVERACISVFFVTFRTPFPFPKKNHISSIIISHHRCFDFVPENTCGCFDFVPENTCGTPSSGLILSRCFDFVPENMWCERSVILFFGKGKGVRKVKKKTEIHGRSTVSKSESSNERPFYQGVDRDKDVEK